MSERLVYGEPVEDSVERLDSGLREVRDYFPNMSKQFAILELLGIGSPIPTTVEVVGGSLEGKTVMVKPSSIELSELPGVKIAIEASPTLLK